MSDTEVNENLGKFNDNNKADCDSSITNTPRSTEMDTTHLPQNENEDLHLHEDHEAATAPTSVVLKLGDKGNTDGEESKVDEAALPLAIADNTIQQSCSDIADSSVIRGRANSPTSQCTDITRDDSSTVSGSRELAFNRAMSLLSARCRSQQSGLASRSQTPLVTVKNPPLGRPFLQLFYVQQHRPLPMPPMKAWRGFYGNVYFQPINVSTVPLQAGGDTERLASLSRAAEQSLSGSKRSLSSGNQPTASRGSGYKTKGGRGQPSSMPSAAGSRDIRTASTAGRRGVYTAPVDNSPNYSEQQAVGSLRISSGAKKSRAGSVRWEPSKLRKGSVVRELTMKGLKLPPINHAVFRGLPVKRHQSATDSQHVIYTSTEITSHPTH